MPNQNTPPSSTSSNNGASPDAQQFRVVRKRNRVPLSCAPCRHRKLKCNRAHPCDNCTKRGDVSSCTYATPGSRTKNAAANSANASPDDMQNRIDRLEGLVLSLMTTGNSQPGATAAAHAAIDASRSNSLSTASDARRDTISSSMVEEEEEEEEVEEAQQEEEDEVDQVSRGIGIMKMDNGRTVFASDAHWYAILGEIGEVKRYFESHKEDYKQHMAKVQAAKADESPGTAFLLQCAPARDKNELLNAFPNKANADRLIARYFNAFDPSVHIIHGPSFQKHYDRHWQNPGETSSVWLGMCFAMMTLALQSYHRAGDEPPEYRGKSLMLSHEFRRLTAQALLLSDITQPLAQILETLILHVQAEYGRSSDAEPGVLLLVGLAVRLAMRMGYHRDPGPHPQITPFQGEMRRRVWTLVRTIDLLISFQFGLPAMIRSDLCDVESPRNLYDDELYEDMKSLPPSRPVFEATPMSYMIAKGKMSFLFGRILERTQSITNPPSYEETMKFDQELQESRASHPTLLQMRGFTESARDPANLIMQRLGLEMMYLRSLFVLHRRFIGRGRDSSRFAYSRKTCIDASLQLLDHQATLHREGQSGGRLKSVKWYISSLTTHDFLVAAMLVCLDLYHTAEEERRQRKSGANGSLSSAEMQDEERRDQMMQAVEHCIGIWESVRESSMEAYKASIALRVMVDKLKLHHAQQVMYRDSVSPASSSGPSGLSSSGLWSERSPNFGMFPNGAVADVGGEDMAPEQSAAMTLGMLSSGGMSPGFGMSGVSPAQAPNSMTGILNEPLSGRTGLTPGYSGLEGAASPFSQMFGQSGAGNLLGMDSSLDIDWGAWDSYIQGTGNTGMDPANGVWPMMNVDLNGIEGAAGPAGNSTTSNGATGKSEGVFMGATGSSPQNGMN